MRFNQSLLKKQVQLFLRILAGHAHGPADLGGGQRPPRERERTEHLPAGAGKTQWLNQTVAPMQKDPVATDNVSCVMAAAGSPAAMVVLALLIMTTSFLLWKLVVNIYWPAQEADVSNLQAGSPLQQQLPATTHRLQTRANKGSALAHAREACRENGERRGGGGDENAGFGGATLARPCPQTAPTLGETGNSGRKKTNREGLVF